MGLGQRICKARVVAGFSQEDLGDALGVTRSSVSLWEKGRSRPEPARLAELAEVLGVSIEYLTTGDGRPPVRLELPVGFRREAINRVLRLIVTGKLDAPLARLGYLKQKKKAPPKRGQVLRERAA